MYTTEPLVPHSPQRVIARSHPHPRGRAQASGRRRSCCPHLDLCDSDLRVRLRARRAAHAAPVVVTSSTHQQSLPIRTPPTPHAVCYTGPRPSTALACSPPPFPHACIGNGKLPMLPIDKHNPRYPFRNSLRCANLLARDTRGDAANTARITVHDRDLQPAPTYTHVAAHTTRTPDHPRAHCSNPATAHTPRSHPARSSIPCSYGSCTFRPLPPRPPLTSSACGSAESSTNTVPHADCMCSCAGIDACSP